MSNYTPSPNNTDNIYFAAKEAEKCAGVLLNRARTSYTSLNANAYLEKLRLMWNAYYGVYSSTWTGNHQVSFTGEQGELVAVPVNHFRNIAQHIYVMVTANRPSMQARAINTDYKSLAQTYLANGILDYYMRQKGLEDCLKKAVEMAVVLGAGFVKLSWNATGGDIFDVNDDGTFNYQGELEFTNLSPLDVVVDGMKESWSNEWVLARSYINRYSLIAKFPDMKDKILSLPSKADLSVTRLALFSNDDTDDVCVYEFYHKATEAVPEGRYMLFADSDVVFVDAKMPYREIPIFRISASDIMGTPYGYSPMFDIYPIQECINTLVSSVMTNQSAFAVQNLFIPRGADISIAELEGGMNIIEANAKPEPLQLTASPPEVFKMIDMMIQTAETLSGVNSVARGNPESSLKSGNALALVQSMALQFISGLQQSYVKLVEDVGTTVINILKDFANAPKVVEIVGKNNRAYLKEFTSEDITNINRVIVDMGNPLSRTTAGRVQMAEQMMQMGVITNPKQYFEVINTGALEVTFEGEMNELLLIKSENERMVEGENPIVTPLDKHSMHIQEHRAVLADPDLRKDPNLVSIALNHIQEHINYLRSTDPALLGLIGEQAMGPPGGSAPAPGGGQPGGAPPQGGSEAAGMMTPVNGLPQPQQQVSGPGISNEKLPAPASPPPPFKHLPTNPADMLPG